MRSVIAMPTENINPVRASLGVEAPPKDEVRASYVKFLFLWKEKEGKEFLKCTTEFLNDEEKTIAITNYTYAWGLDEYGNYLNKLIIDRFVEIYPDSLNALIQCLNGWDTAKIEITPSETYVFAYIDIETFYLFLKTLFHYH